MINYLYLCLAFTLTSMSFTLNAAENSEAFIVQVKDRSIRVTSPKKKTEIVGIIVKNETFDKIISELRSEKKVLKRFVLQVQGTQSLQVNTSNIKSLYYVSVAPPFQAVQLKFSERAYEIPEKK